MNSAADQVNSVGDKEPRIVNSRLIAVVAFAIMTFSLTGNMRDLHRPISQSYDWKLLALDFLPAWIVAGLNVFFYVYLAYLILLASREFERSDERLLLAWFGSGLLRPLYAIWPAMLEVKPYMHLALAMCAWMAATSLLVFNFRRKAAQASGPELTNDQQLTTND